MLKSDRIIALDIGASSVVYGQFIPLKDGGLELIDFAIQPVDPEAPSDDSRQGYVDQAIEELASAHNLKGASALVCVPGQSVFTRFVKLPPAGKDKLLQIVQYEAQQNVPFPINEVVWDFQLVGSSDGEVDVMLAAIKSDIIERQCDGVRAAGLEPELVDVGSMALYNAVRYNYPELPECTLVADIGARSTDLVFIEQGRVFSRSIPVGGNTITQQIMKEFDLSFVDAEETKMNHAFVSFGGAYEPPKSEVADKVSKAVRSVMTRLHAEITRSVNFYRTQQGGSKPGLLLLTGGSSMIPYTDVFLKEKLQVEVEYLNTFQNVTVRDGLDLDLLSAHAQEMPLVVGTALRKALTCPIELDLLPPRIREERIFRRKQPFFVAAGIAAAVLVAIWAGFFSKLAVIKEQTRTTVSTEVRELRGVEAGMNQLEGQMADVSQRVAKLDRLVERRSDWLLLLDEMHKLVPDGMWLTDLRATRVVPAMTDNVPAAGDELGFDDGMGAPDEFGGPEGDGEEEKELGPFLAFELTGAAYIDKNPSSASIHAFRDALRDSEAFADEETRIVWAPAPGADASYMQFKILAVLQQPLEL